MFNYVVWSSNDDVINSDQLLNELFIYYPFGNTDNIKAKKICTLNVQNKGNVKYFKELTLIKIYKYFDSYHLLEYLQELNESKNNLPSWWHHLIKDLKIEMKKSAYLKALVYKIHNIISRNHANVPISSLSNLNLNR